MKNLNKFKYHVAILLLCLVVSAVLFYRDREHWGIYSFRSAVIPEKWMLVRGVTYKEAKNLQRAEEEILQIADKNVRSAALFDLYCSNGMHDKAIGMLKEEMRLVPNDWHRMVLLGECYIGKKEFANAAAWLKKAEYAEPQNTFLYRTYGLLFASQKDYSKALRYLSMSMQLAHENADKAYTYGLYSDVYLEIKDYVRAKDCAEKALALLPNEQNFAKNIAKVNRMMRQ